MKKLFVLSMILAVLGLMGCVTSGPIPSTTIYVPVPSISTIVEIPAGLLSEGAYLTEEDMKNEDMYNKKMEKFFEFLKSLEKAGCPPGEGCG